MDKRLFRSPIAGEISPSRFKSDKLLDNIERERQTQNKLELFREKIKPNTQKIKRGWNLQSNDIEGDVITSNTSPGTIVRRRWTCPVIEHIVHIFEWLLNLQQRCSFFFKLGYFINHTHINQNKNNISQRLRKKIN